MQNPASVYFRAGVFLLAAMALGIVWPLYAQSGPAFSTKTPLSGELGSTFVVFLPIFNTGAAEADNVQITSATLGHAMLTSPAFPVFVQTLAPGDHYELNLQFSDNNLTMGQNYLLTVRGTYTVNSQAFGFAVNRFLAPTIPSASMLTELQHWVVLDAMRVFANSLPRLNRSADEQAMLTFIQSRPEFVDSGIDSSSGSVWATFANGEEVAFGNDRNVLNGSAPTAAQVSTGTWLRPSIPGNLVASTVPILPPSASTVAVNDVELPASSNVRLLNTLSSVGGLFIDGSVLTDLTTMLIPQNYQVTREDPSVANLIPVGGDGVFYYTSHGDFVGKGTLLSPLRFGVWTSTKADSYQQTVLPTSDVFGTTSAPATLIKILETKGLDLLTGLPITEWHYAITASFVRKHFQPFSSNSFIYIDACSSDDPRTGPDSAQDFKKAFFEKNASVYAGWSATVDDSIAAHSAQLVFDRLLGANMFFLETGPPQRPFPWDSLGGSSGDLMMHNLGADPNSGALLKFTPNPKASTSVFGLLAPSIATMDILEGAIPQFLLFGVFGSDPGANGGVFVGGSDPTLPSQTNTAGGVGAFPCDWTTGQGFEIQCGALLFTGAGSFGNVQVTVRGHNSNVARITEWQGPFTFKMKSTGGAQDTFDTLSGTLTLNTAFRADIRSYRQVIHDPPVPPTAPGFELIPPLSSGPFSCTGGAQNVIPGTPPSITNYTWTGSGNLPPFDPSSLMLPPKQSFDSSGILMGTISAGTVSSLTLNLELTARGGVTECTATIMFSPGGGTKTSSFDIPFGGINLSLILDPVTAVIQAPKKPLVFPNTGCLFTPGDSSCNVTLNWEAISPVGNSAPNPNSAR